MASLFIGVVIGSDPKSERMRRIVRLVKIAEGASMSVPYRIPFTPMWYGARARTELMGILCYLSSS